MTSRPPAQVDSGSTAPPPSYDAGAAPTAGLGTQAISLGAPPAAPAAAPAAGPTPAATSTSAPTPQGAPAPTTGRSAAMPSNNATQTTAIPTATPSSGRGSSSNRPAGPVIGEPGGRGVGSSPVQPSADAGVDVGGKGGRSGKNAARGPRRARLQLRHVDTWSALKISLVLSIAFFFVWMVAVGLLYGVLSQLGVFDTVNDLLGQLNSSSGDTDTASEVITTKIIFGGAAVIGAINVVLLTALCTVGTLMYNLCSDLVGGLEVTLSERD